MKIFYSHLLLFLASASCALANVIHVSPQGTRQAAGSASAPVDKLETALLKSHAGDTILIHGGTYLKTHAVVNCVATADAPLTIKAVPNESVVLDGKGTFASDPKEAEDKAKISGIIDIRFSSHVIVENIEVVHSPGYGIDTWESEYVTVRNSKIHDTYSRGLGGNGAHLLFEGNEVFDTAMSNKDEAVVEGHANGVTGTFWSAGASSWYRADGSLTKDITWRGNKIHDSWGEGLSALHVDGAVLEKNEVYNNYSTMVYIDHSRNVRVDSNYIYYTRRNLLRRDEKEVSPGIMFAAEAYKGTAPIMPENLVITNNVISNVEVGIGFWRDPDNKSATNRYHNVVIANNIIHDTSLVPINLTKINETGLGETRNVLANNIIYQARYLLDGRDEAATILIKNPGIWNVSNNSFPNGLAGILFQDKFASFTDNITGDPQLADPRVVGPLGLLGFVPKASSPLWNAGNAGNRGATVLDAAHDFNGRARNGEKTSIGPFAVP